MINIINKVKRILEFTPLATLLVLLFFNIFLFKGVKINNQLIGDLIGFSLFSILPYLYLSYKLNFKFYSKFSLYGMLFINILNIVDSIYDLNQDIYYDLFEIVFLFVYIIISFIILIRRK